MFLSIALTIPNGVIAQKFNAGCVGDCNRRRSGEDVYPVLPPTTSSSLAVPVSSATVPVLSTSATHQNSRTASNSSTVQPVPAPAAGGSSSGGSYSHGFSPSGDYLDFHTPPSTILTLLGDISIIFVLVEVAYKVRTILPLSPLPHAA